MEINLITFNTSLNKQDDILKPHEALLNEIETYFKVRYIYYRNVDAVDKDALQLVFIASGGVERLVVEYFEQLTHPIIMLTDGLQNSLPAALEISTWIRSRGMKSHIIHGEPINVVKEIKRCYDNFEAYKKMRVKRIGVLGPPSPWLIASNVDFLLAKRRWGTEMINLPLEKVINRFYKIKDDDIGEKASLFAVKALACLESTPEDLLKAMRLYKAIKMVCEEEKLDAFTINCFSLIETLGTTGCLAISLLNDEGIIAGCEGDLQSIFTMVAVNALTGKSCFMGNPSLVSVEKNEFILAHCAISTKLTDKYIIRSHFETKSGIGIQGILPSGDVTLVKCGGECLDEFFVSSGSLIENTNYLNVCRTQARIKLNNPVSYFLNNPLGNHHILIPGNYENELVEFFLANGCKRIE